MDYSTVRHIRKILDFHMNLEENTDQSGKKNFTCIISSLSLSEIELQNVVALFR